jgi:hypothetical protein
LRTVSILTSSPILTVDWKADSGNRWTVPLGGGIGKIFHFGRLPVNNAAICILQCRHARRWRELAAAAQVQLMFPK